MPRNNSTLRNATLVALICLAAAQAQAAQEEQQPEKETPSYTTESLRGRVVFMADALERLHGVSTVAESRENTLALETPRGKLYPLVEDKRGHSFRLDDRLMGTPMELLVRRHEGSPAIQVIRMYMLEDGEKFLVDYWCDICSIRMFELKPCDCCQGPVRLRKRKVGEDGEPIPESGPPPSE